VKRTRAVGAPSCADSAITLLSSISAAIFIGVRPRARCCSFWAARALHLDGTHHSMPKVVGVGSRCTEAGIHRVAEEVHAPHTDGVQT
jgi:hypothetical protein